MSQLLSDFDYSYPDELVALYPHQKRDESRMMVVDRVTGQFAHQNFKNFPDYFQKGDVLVVNESKVFPCRLFTKKKTGGKLEIFLVRHSDDLKKKWEVMVTDSRKIKKGDQFVVAPELTVIFDDDISDQKQTRSVTLNFEGDFDAMIQKVGHIPLPPYIKRQDEKAFDTDRYQTVYAKNTGSVAAPTAGFHLTDEVLTSLKNLGVIIAPVTLHVGLGTFLPVKVEDITQHLMHEEFFSMDQSSIDILTQAKKEGKRITAIGTTSVRVLESAFDKNGKILQSSGFTRIFIYPPYEFKMVNRLLTNFHQPKSTLLMLVSAFLGKETVKKAYSDAIQNKYRLFSYGDCMFLT